MGLWGGGGLKNELQADFMRQFGTIPIENGCYFPELGGDGPFGLHEAPPLLDGIKELPPA
jgi:hypothetical protein